MRRTRQRGSLVEAVPVVLTGLVIMYGALQVALFMSGKHAADLAAYRAARVLEARAEQAAEAQGAARREAETMCSIGYPESLSSTQVQTHPSQGRVDVRLRMEPLLPLPLFEGADTFEPSTVKAKYPPSLGGDR